MQVFEIRVVILEPIRHSSILNRVHILTLHTSSPATTSSRTITHIHPNLLHCTFDIQYTNMSPDTLSLAGKTALVTGSGRETGIGAAIARAFARNGASVAIHYVSENSKARAEKVASDISKEFGTKTTVVQGGVENNDTAKNMVEKILKAFGVDHIDILGMLWVAVVFFLGFYLLAIGQN